MRLQTLKDLMMKQAELLQEAPKVARKKKQRKGKGEERKVKEKGKKKKGKLNMRYIAYVRLHKTSW
jgi:hypothetical protein